MSAEADSLEIKIKSHPRAARKDSLRVSQRLRLLYPRHNSENVVSPLTLMPGIHPGCFQAAAELPLLQDKAGAGEAVQKILENIFIFIHSGRRATMWPRFCSGRTVSESGKLFFSKFKVCFRFFYYWTLSNSHKIIISVSADWINIPLFWIFSSNLDWGYLYFLLSLSYLKKTKTFMWLVCSLTRKIYWFSRTQLWLFNLDAETMQSDKHVENRSSGFAHIQQGFSSRSRCRAANTRSRASAEGHTAI